MLLRRFFERARARSSSDTHKQTCLCTTAKRDSLYDDPAVSLTKYNERQSADEYGFVRSDKPRRLLMRQASLDESDGEDDTSITEKLRHASSQSPANIPMLVVVSFNPDAKGLQKQQIEIQRGFPVNAQYILNEWLFIKTADNEGGYVPYVCCRPMFRRQSVKCIENSYKPYDFELNKPHPRKSSFTPPTNKKLPLSTNFGSPSYLFRKSSPSKKRQDVTSSSCGGDSGVSDCESSSNIHQNLDSSTKRSTRLSNIRSLRSSSSILKKTGLMVQDLPLKKSIKTNQIKSQLLISSNSAFTQIVKKNQRQESDKRKPFHHEQEIPVSSSSFKTNFHRLYDSYDETSKLSSPSSKYLTDNNNNNNMISSPRIRRTPYARRSLPHHIQSIGKKPSYIKLSSSPDPFQIIQEQQLRNIVLAESSLPTAMIPAKSTLERHFSDLSLNQIENDSLSPSTPLILIHNQPSLSCSSSSSSSTSTTSSSSDGNTTPFIHIQMSNYRTGRIPVVYASPNINNNNNNNSNSQAKKSNSFIHNVSITV